MNNLLCPCCSNIMDASTEAQDYSKYITTKTLCRNKYCIDALDLSKSIIKRYINSVSDLYPYASAIINIHHVNTDLLSTEYVIPFVHSQQLAFLSGTLEVDVNKYSGFTQNHTKITEIYYNSYKHLIEVPYISLDLQNLKDSSNQIINRLTKLIAFL
jgi:hypothetical protein